LPKLAKTGQYLGIEEKVIAIDLGEIFLWIVFLIEKVNRPRKIVHAFFGDGLASESGQGLKFLITQKEKKVTKNSGS